MATTLYSRVTIHESPVGRRLYNGSEQRPDACRQRHCERTPERDAHCARHHISATGARSYAT